MGTPSSMNEAQQFLDTDANNGVCFVKKSSQFKGTDDLSCYNEGLRSSEKIIKQIVMVSDFGLSGDHKIPEPLCLADFTIEDNKMERKNFKGKKRAKGADSKEQNDVSNHLVKSPLERDVKMQRTESQLVHNSNKSDVKKAEEVNKEEEEEEEEDDDDSKHGYAHIRAKRGKATNSHSLAERLRREKISERMRILQDLVPGCNKITGKAVMLDEIINYVQSLQQQVELLSMKLAAVNPELNFDIEQNFYRDIFWLSPGLSPSYTYYPGTAQIPSEMSMAAAIPQLSSVAQIENQWDEELENAIQMSFFPPQPAINSGFHDKVSRKA